MRFSEFEAHARAEWERIPETYREGVDGLVIERAPRAHPNRSDVFTLGECITESYPSDFGSAETTRSAVVLYYGSFRALAQQDPGFDWHHEIWETLTHELQHHLESLADDDVLGGVDYAVDENFKRRDGEPYDPYFYRSGLEIGNRVFRIEDDIFLEQSFRHPAATVRFAYGDSSWRFPWPDNDADVTFVAVPNVVGPPELLHVVLVRESSVFRALRGLLSGARVRTDDVEIDATPDAE